MKKRMTKLLIVLAGLFLGMIATGLSVSPADAQSQQELATQCRAEARANLAEGVRNRRCSRAALNIVEGRASVAIFRCVNAADSSGFGICTQAARDMFRQDQISVQQQMQRLDRRLDQLRCDAAGGQINFIGACVL